MNFLLQIVTIISVIVITFIVFVATTHVAFGDRSARKAPATDQNRGDLRRLWDRHCNSLAQLEADYVTFETDPWSAFHRPLLADVGEPETAQFHKALARAQDLRTDRVPDTRSWVDEFGDAVRDARIAWQVADRHARDIAVPTATEEDRRRLRQAEDALRVALDERAPIPERQAALDRVHHLIKGLTRIEPAAQDFITAELDQVSRKAID